MSIDLEKLTAAPWHVGQAEHPRDRGVYWTGAKTRVALCGSSVAKFGQDDSEANAAFIALARNAFDVMMRRPWIVRRWNDSSFGVCEDGTDAMCGSWPREGFNMPNSWPDPFTALVEADKWYRENVEGKS